MSLSLVGFPDEINAIQQDIYSIINLDSGYGSFHGGFADNVIVTYTRHNSGFGPQLVDGIVNGLQNFVVVNGILSTDTVPDGTNRPITAYGGGVTFPPDPQTGDINIYYDITACSHTNYFVVDASGKKIADPPYIILAHEFSHAYQFATTGASDDRTALVNENKLRAQFGCPLTSLNDPTGGCGFTGSPCNPPKSPPEVAKSPTGRYCFIASAAFGSPDAVLVSLLQELRDTYSRQSALVGGVISALMDQYYHFSPHIAREMKKSQALKMSISQLVVEPLLCYYLLCDHFIKSGHDALVNMAELMLSSQLAVLREGLLRKERASHISAELLQLRPYLARKSHVARPIPAPPSSIGMPQVLSYMVSSIVASAPPNNWMAWAFMEPLIIYWSTLAEMESSPSQHVNLGSYWAYKVKEWLGAVPIPPYFDNLSEETVRQELTRMANTVLTSPSVRQKVGIRLLEKYGHQVSYDLNAFLQAAGYISVSLED